MVGNGFKEGLVRCFILSLIVVLIVGLAPVVAQEQSEQYSVSVQPIVQGLTAPTFLVSANDDSGRMFVLDQTGKIWVISADGQQMPDPFLDLSSKIVQLKPDYDERGVLGMAFHPDFANNGRVFVYYSAPLRAEGPAGWDHTNVLSEFSVSKDNPNTADLASEKIVWQIDQPQFNHDSGHIAFGPDGFLYIPIGDGGGANDTDMGHTPNLGNGQDLTNQHGSILRIDVNGAPGSYAVPPDNPFVSNSNAAPEIYAFGFRNPYHLSFDSSGKNQLIVADEGQDLYEEIDVVQAGGNYGWNIKEALHCFDSQNSKQPPSQCTTTGAGGEPLVDPVVEYSHDQIGIAIIGGYVYRGSALADLAGYYIFGDFTKTLDGGPDGSLLWAEPSDQGGAWKWGQLTVAGMPNNRIGAYVRAFGQGPDGELYILTNQELGPQGTTGTVYKIVPATGATSETTPQPGAGGAATSAPAAGATSAPSTGATSPATTEQPSG